jgi:hypothetical protein
MSIGGLFISVNRAFARKASTGRRIIRDDVAKGFWRLRTICCGRTSQARKQTRQAQSLILAVIGAIVAGRSGRVLARVQDDLRKAIARPLACDAHHGETEPLAYSRDRLAKMPA